MPPPLTNLLLREQPLRVTAQKRPLHSFRIEKLKDKNTASQLAQAPYNGLSL